MAPFIEYEGKVRQTEEGLKVKIEKIGRVMPLKPADLVETNGEVEFPIGDSLVTLQGPWDLLKWPVRQNGHHKEGEKVTGVIYVSEEQFEKLEGKLRK